MATVTDQTRNAVWRTLCDLEWNGRYYDALADKYRFRYLALRFGILGSVPVEGAILYFAVSYPWLFIPAVLVGVVLAVLTVWDAVSNYAEQAAIIRLTAFACDDLKRDSEALWRRIEAARITNDEAESAHESITERWATATQRVQSGTHHRLNVRAYQDANQDIRNRYAV